jgi:type IV pilus assembly protein PilV
MHTAVTPTLAHSNHRGLGGRRAAPRGRISGFTIAEVLVSLVVLSTGLLGIAKLVLDNMRANPTAAGNYKTALNTPASSYAGQNCLNTACPVAANLATYDLYTWKTRLAAPTGALPGGQGSVTVSATAPIMATIVVQWDDSAAQSMFGGTPIGVVAYQSVTLETALHP